MVPVIGKTTAAVLVATLKARAKPHADVLALFPFGKRIVEAS